MIAWPSIPFEYYKDASAIAVQQLLNQPGLNLFWCYRVPASQTLVGWRCVEIIETDGHGWFGRVKRRRGRSMIRRTLSFVTNEGEPVICPTRLCDLILASLKHELWIQKDRQLDRRAA